MSDERGGRARRERRASRRVSSFEDIIQDVPPQKDEAEEDAGLSSLLCCRAFFNYVLREGDDEVTMRRKKMSLTVFPVLFLSGIVFRFTRLVGGDELSTADIGSLTGSVGTLLLFIYVITMRRVPTSIMATYHLMIALSVIVLDTERSSNLGVRSCVWFAPLLVFAKTTEIGLTSTFVFGIACTWELIVCLEKIYRYGLYDIITSTQEERFDAMCHCAKLPCPMDPIEAMVSSLWYIVVYVVVLFSYKMYTDDMTKERDKMAASVAIANNIAQALTRFDLPEALQCLDSERRNLPDELHAAFFSLIENLESYRPFLPEALFQVPSTSVEQTTWADGPYCMDTPWVSQTKNRSPVKTPEDAASSSESARKLQPHDRRVDESTDDSVNIALGVPGEMMTTESNIPQIKHGDVSTANSHPTKALKLRTTTNIATVATLKVTMQDLSVVWKTMQSRGSAAVEALYTELKWHKGELNVVVNTTMVCSWGCFSKCPRHMTAVSQFLRSVNNRLAANPPENMKCDINAGFATGPVHCGPVRLADRVSCMTIFGPVVDVAMSLCHASAELPTAVLGTSLSRWPQDMIASQQIHALPHARPIGRWLLVMRGKDRRERPKTEAWNEDDIMVTVTDSLNDVVNLATAEIYELNLRSKVVGIDEAGRQTTESDDIVATLSASADQGGAICKSWSKDYLTAYIKRDLVALRVMGQFDPVVAKVADMLEHDEHLPHASACF